jgi:hypothetical protein
MNLLLNAEPMPVLFADDDVVLLVCFYECYWMDWQMITIVESGLYVELKGRLESLQRSAEDEVLSEHRYVVTRVLEAEVLSGYRFEVDRWLKGRDS